MATKTLAKYLPQYSHGEGEVETEHPLQEINSVIKPVNITASCKLGIHSFRKRRSQRLSLSSSLFIGNASSLQSLTVFEGIESDSSHAVIILPPLTYATQQAYSGRTARKQRVVGISLSKYGAHRRSSEALFLRPQLKAGLFRALRRTVLRIGKANLFKPATFLISLNGGSSKLYTENCHV